MTWIIELTVHGRKWTGWNGWNWFWFVRLIYFFSFPLWFITGYWIQFTVHFSRTLLFTHSVYKSLHLLFSNSQPIPPCPTFRQQKTFLVITNISRVRADKIPWLRVTDIYTVFFFQEIYIKCKKMLYILKINEIILWFPSLNQHLKNNKESRSKNHFAVSFCTDHTNPQLAIFPILKSLFDPYFHKTKHSK